ncbi:hypothetical protein DENSPDRAFT_833354 [Dentipellis sp. KUC8613]|nr:hypothetical protein DENSPDRAFT_833354 [Dentipellis sp. KUC8613]
MSFLPALRLSRYPHLNHLRLQRYTVAHVRHHIHEQAARSHPNIVSTDQQVASELSEIIHQNNSSNASSSEGTTQASKRKRKSKEPKSAESAEPVSLLSESSKAEAYLESLELTGQKPLLSDLEGLRPPLQPSAAGPKYAEAYYGLVDSICRSFTSSQLRQFTQDYQLAHKYSAAHRTKKQYAKAIVTQQWQWPSPEELERARKEQVEVATQSFPVTSSQLFVIIGKDGGDLLELSKKHNVHISLASKPLALRVQGAKSALKALSQEIVDIKKGIVEETLQLHTQMPLRNDLLQRIARTTGAFIENGKQNGQVRICARDPVTLYGAKRLAIRSILDLNQSNPLFISPERGAQEGAPEHTSPGYNAYPFVSSRPLPWTTGVSNTYRCRRIGDYSIASHAFDLNQTKMDHVISVDGKVVDLKHALLKRLDTAVTNDASMKTSINGSLGHLLFIPEPTTVDALIPSLPTAHSYSDLSHWISAREHPVFVSSLPLQFLERPPSHQTLAHHLVYHRLVPEGSSHSESDITRFLELEVVLPALQSVSGEELPDAVVNPTVSCSMGVKAEADILLLDRAMDVRFSAVRSLSVESHDLPVELQEYLASLQTYLEYTDTTASQPTPPAVLRYAGSDYVLHHSVSVRQSREELSTMTNSMAVQSVLDLESGEKHSLCQLTCEGYDSEQQWNSFLRSCDDLAKQARESKITAIGRGHMFQDGIII